MLPLSRPLFDRQDDRPLTLAVAASLLTATLVMVAMLAGIA